jgi:phosphoenolpyruvate carboxykinase (GTP)
MAALTEARTCYWCDGSQAEYDRLCQQLVAAGTLMR